MEKRGSIVSMSKDGSITEILPGFLYRTFPSIINNIGTTEEYDRVLEFEFMDIEDIGEYEENKRVLYAQLMGKYNIVEDEYELGDKNIKVYKINI